MAINHNNIKHDMQIMTLKCKKASFPVLLLLLLTFLSVWESSFLVLSLFHCLNVWEVRKKQEVGNLCFKRRPIYECRCDERLKTKSEGSIRLVYTGLLGGLEHLKTQTRLIDEKFASVMGECVIVKL
jgi:hypothetical protein